MISRVSLVAAAVAAVASLSLTPASADVVTGPIKGLDASATQKCGLIDTTIVVTRTSKYDQVSGTEFTVEKLSGFDLRTADGWKRAEELEPGVAKLLPTELSRTATSDMDGKAQFMDLPSGVYLVTGVAPRDGYHHTPAPFVLTLPTGSDGGWDCAPVINAKFEPEPDLPDPSKPPFPPFVPIPIPIPPAPQPPAPQPSAPETHMPTVPTSASPDVPVGKGAPGTSISKRLASTGASVSGVIAVAAAVLVVGLAMRRNRK